MVSLGDGVLESPCARRVGYRTSMRSWGVCSLSGVLLGVESKVLM
jgi:hypothetical protein